MFPKNIAKSEPVIEISSDASGFGWGAVCNNILTRGAFNIDQMEYYINAKELVAAKFSLKIFVRYLMHMSSCYQTILLLHMASAKNAL